MICIATLHPALADTATDSLSERGACMLLKEKVGFVSFSTLGDANWYVIALRSNRKCPGICSNLMGWLAVNRKSGSVHDYDMCELHVGAAVKSVP